MCALKTSEREFGRMQGKQDKTPVSPYQVLEICVQEEVGPLATERWPVEHDQILSKITEYMAKIDEAAIPTNISSVIIDEMPKNLKERNGSKSK